MTGRRVSGLERGLRRAGGALAVFLVCAPAPPAGAAAPPAKRKPAPAARGERPDVFVGFSLTEAGSARLSGWTVSGSHPLWRSVSLVGDLSGHYGSYAGADLTEIEFLVGGRRHWRWRGFLPFGELLLGGVRHEASVATPDGSLSATGTDLAVAPGIGADYRLDRRWAARVGLNVRFVHAGAWEADPRAAIGIVYRFSRR